MTSPLLAINNRFEKSVFTRVKTTLSELKFLIPGMNRLGTGDECCVSICTLRNLH